VLPVAVGKKVVTEKIFFKLLFHDMTCNYTTCHKKQTDTLKSAHEN